LTGNGGSLAAAALGVEIVIDLAVAGCVPAPMIPWMPAAFFRASVVAQQCPTS